MTFHSVCDQHLSEKAAAELREAIETGELSSGSRLVEQTLAPRMGGSHISIREALAKLSEEGLVERTPRRGGRVAALSEEALEKIFSLRVVLEQFVRLSVRAPWTPQREKKLRKIVRAMVASSKKSDLDAMFARDRTFHDALCKMADHALLVNIASQLRIRINGFVRATNGALSTGELAEHARSHHALVDAIATRDREVMNAAISQPITIAAARIIIESRPRDAAEVVEG